MIESLTQRFAVDNEQLSLQFYPGAEGIPWLKLKTTLGMLELCLQGAHLTRWSSAGLERLWLSRQARLQRGKAIRGGIPLCWPWFGPHPDRDDYPAHGWTSYMHVLFLLVLLA